jgi:hypothetical protein
MEGGSAYVAWWDIQAGQGRVVRVPRERWAPRDVLTRTARAAQVAYYLEPTNMLGSGVLPTAEPLWDESVNVSSSGVISFRFTRLLAGVAGQAPPRAMAPNAPSAFPVAQINPSGSIHLTGALFPRWSVANVLTDCPADSDKHFMHAGSLGSRTPTAIIVGFNTAVPTAEGQALANAAQLDECDPVTAFSSDGSLGAMPAGPAAPESDSSPAVLSSSDMMSMMGGMATAFFATRHSDGAWGVVLFQDALIETNWELTGAVVLSSLFAMATTVLAAVSRPVELRGADPERHMLWAAAGFACTAARTGGHYCAMLLVMTFNVWIILGVLLGHAAGYLTLAGFARRGSLPAEVRAVGEEESGLEQQPELSAAAQPKREATLLQEVTSGSCCAQNCECA